MKRLISVALLALLVCAFACTTTKVATKEESWKQLIDLKLDESLISFQNRIQVDSSDKLNYLGLAYAQCALDEELWLKTLGMFTQNPDSLLLYGHVAQAFKSYSKGISNPDFSLDEFKAMHLDGKFKTKRNFRMIEGEYKKLKPIGVWRIYNLNGELIREMDKGFVDCKVIPKPSLKVKASVFLLKLL